MQLQSSQAGDASHGTGKYDPVAYYLRKRAMAIAWAMASLEDGLISILTWPEGLSQPASPRKTSRNASVLPLKRWTISLWSKPAEGAESDRGRSLSRADHGLEVPDGKKRPACLRPMVTRARHPR